MNRTIFPSLVADVQATFLTIPRLISEIEAIANVAVNVVKFPLPNDLSDSFAAVGWARPELYLNSDIRNGISSFANIAENELNLGLANLYKDLETGVWDRKHGHLRQQEQYDVGYRFVYTAV